MEAKQQHLYLQRADWALETALHIWLIYRPFLPRVPIKPWLDITDSLMMVQTAAAVSVVSPSTEDWLHEAALPQIDLRKWHKRHEVFISLSLPVRCISGEVKGKACVWYMNYCLLPNFWIRPPVPPIGPQIICWSSHTHWSSTFMRKNMSTVNELWKCIISSASQHMYSIYNMYVCPFGIAI